MGISSGDGLTPGGARRSQHGGAVGDADPTHTWGPAHIEDVPPGRGLTETMGPAAGKTAAALAGGAVALASAIGTAVRPRIRVRPRRRRRASAAHDRSHLPANQVALAVAAIILVVGIVGSIATSYARSVLHGLPDPAAESAPLLRSVVIYDDRGQVLAERNSEGAYHVVLGLGQMGKVAPMATLAAEDRGFYSHPAVNVLATARALVVDVLAGQPVEGGSTITQQLVKIEFLQPRRTLSRKLQEAALAYQLENKYSKDRILELYLNRVYYGHGAYGIGAATKTYFGADKDAKDLSVAQAAFLAGLISAPNTNDPQTHYDRARSRELYVLGQMRQANDISLQQMQAVSQEDIQKELKFDTSFRRERAHHFVDYVMSRLEATFGAAATQQGGYQVHTTLDPALQRLAEKSVADGVGAMSYYGVNNGDLLAANPKTGAILAWVGSADYNNAGIGGQFDVVLSPRQPGSSFKVYDYVAALRDHRITLSTCLQDEPTDFNGYRPVDFDNSYMGTISARTALVQSRNIPAVQVASMEGIDRVIAYARSLGIRSPLQPYLSTAIGGSEVTLFEHLQGYQVFADQGHHMPLLAITGVTDASGNAVYTTTPGRQDGQSDPLSAAEAYLITNVLKDYQTVWHLGWQRQMAGKSGTSGGTQFGVHPDAWMMAYNPDIVVGAWAGNTGPNGAGRPVSAFGVNTGETVLAEFINGMPAQWDGWYTPPADLVTRGGELYLAGTENMASCQSHGGGGHAGGGGEHGRGNKNH